ncbi:MAG: DUF59 domain-containing protein [Anaerolineales bacterium]|nr:DUF59 domain-containing protein [Anaerolineales bacterium]
MSSIENSARLHWQLEDTHPDIAAKLRQGWQDVKDPELGLSIIELGMIREVVLKEDELQIKMILTTPFCPYAPALFDMTTKKAEHVTGKMAFVNLGLEPWDPSMMEDGLAAEWGLL